MKKIGIIGSGVVGKTLAKGFLQYGYPTFIASRSTAIQAALAAEIGNSIRTGSFEEAAQFADILVWAVKGTAAEAALQVCNIANLAGKTILDATNPIAYAPPQDGVLTFFTASPNSSLMESLQALAPDAHFVKCFSCVGSALMVNPKLEDGTPTMFICGNSASAKADAIAILTQFGWDYADMGSSLAARAIEPLSMLWCIPGFKDNQWGHAFKLLKK